ncbi:serine/arginine-rich splicing factor RSZ22-like [Nicotiana sylvestris]|uniref:serine/arginine-rich splicing factor RSZ22-like n=1 Tax=Nicotiana sylvestris TaxID=4096 RepID=UPI00388CDBC8
MRFVDGVTYQLRILMTRERVSGATFEKFVDISREIESVRRQEQDEREAKRPRGSGASTSHSGAWGSIQSPSPAPGSCYECGELGHMWRQCPHRLGGSSQQRSHTKRKSAFKEGNSSV